MKHEYKEEKRGEVMARWNRSPFKRYSSILFLTVATLGGLLGCNGQVYTVIHPQGVEPDNISYVSVVPKKKCTVQSTLDVHSKPVKQTDPEIVPSPCEFKGVLAYQQDHYTEIYWTTSVLQEVKAADDSKKKVVVMTYNNAEPAKKCEPRIETKQIIRADYSNPYQIVYSPGLLEKYTFKTDFEAGVLKSVNTDSTPDRGETLKNVATALKDISSIPKNVIPVPFGFVPDGAVPQGVTRCTDEPLLQFIVKTSELCRSGINGIKCDYSNYEPPMK